MSRKKDGTTARELMEMHVEALYTRDPDMRLRTINEPWPGEAPASRFFLGRTIEGTTVRRYRHDVPESLVQQLEQLCADEPIVDDLRSKPKHFAEFMRLLQGERFTAGPCFLVPEAVMPSQQIVRLNRENATELARGGFEWLASEVDYAQPCKALVRGGQAVSVCRSVRITPQAHEAGLETSEAFRGKGYAAEVVAGWAAAVRMLGSLPLYSTSWENSASRRVAEKLGLFLYGANFTVA